MTGDPSIPLLWFERLNKKVGLPTWAGSVVFGAGPFLALSVLALFLEGEPLGTLGSFLTEILLVFVVALFSFYSSRYMRLRVGSLADYVDQLSLKSEGTVSQRLSPLSSTRRIFWVFVLNLGLTGPLFVFGGSGTLVENLFSEFPFSWFNFLLATLFWTFGYSMYSISKMGRLPLKLKPYTEDRTLGLRPFGSASLSFTAIYLGFVTPTVAVVISFGALSPQLRLLFLAVYPVGLLFFFLPLRSLHGKLVEAKAKEHAWISPRATDVLERLKSEQGLRIDQATANELVAIDKIERDISQIRSWPFDTGIIVRLSAIIISITAILLSGALRDLLHF